MKERAVVSGLYAIADLEFLVAREIALSQFAAGLKRAGVRTVQLRAKSSNPLETLQAAAMMRSLLPKGETALMMNDRADLALLAGFDGVHVGQGDLAVEDARAVVGEDALVGVSTHTDAQVRLAELTSADYVAIGPVFATGTKQDAAAVVGLEGVRRARALTTKPLVAIGGITRQNAASVIAAGADSLAVISGLLVDGEPVGKVARDFLDFFG